MHDVSRLAAKPNRPGPGVETDGRQRAQSFEPGAVRYIKLGENGKWGPSAFAEAIIPFGYSSIDHEACVTGDWERVRQQLKRMGRTVAGASQGLRELKEFYDLPDDTLWVTMANGQVWWAFADGPVLKLDHSNSGGPARYRPTRAGWSNFSLDGDLLSVRELSSALTRTASYQMTICSIKQSEYLLRRIRGECDPLHGQAVAARDEMREIALRMIRQLDWRDFETLVDLIFTRGGWQRNSALGEHQPDVDLIVTHPITGETAWVQVKSKASQAQLNDYLDRFRREGSSDRFFFICHSAAGALKLPAEPGLHFWTGERVASAALEAGLFNWLIARSQ